MSLVCIMGVSLSRPCQHAPVAAAHEQVTGNDGYGNAGLLHLMTNGFAGTGRAGEVYGR